jgi:signal transduction histidine kinase
MSIKGGGAVYKLMALILGMLMLLSGVTPDIAWAKGQQADDIRVLSLSHGPVLDFTHGEFVYANQTQPPVTGWKRLPLPMTDFFAAETAENAARTNLFVRLRFDRSELGTSPLALTTDYTSERFTLLLNGHHLFQNYSDAAAQTFASYTPWFVAIPPELTNAGANEIIFHLESDTFWSLGLGHVKVGDDRDIRPIYNKSYILQYQAPLIINGVLAVISIAAFLLWLARRQEKAFGWLALLGAVWFVRNLHYSMIKPPFGPAVFWEIANNAIFVLMFVFYGFAATFFDVRNRKRLIGYFALAGGGMILLRIALLQLNQSDLIADLSTIPLAVAVIFIFAQACYRSPKAENFIMLAASVIAILFSFHDFAVLLRLISGAGFFLQPYASLIVFSAFGFALGRRIVTALSTVENINVTLETRIADATSSLKMSETIRRHLEVANAVETERMRLMGEIHDGIGSNLITALSVAERKQESPDTIAILRRSITDLKIAVDSLEPIEGDVISLLANFRHRIEPDLQKAGISFVWQVENAPSLSWLDAVGALHILRILQEIIANILSHSGATSIAVNCGPVSRNGNSGVLIQISDNGQGFNSNAALNGRGISGMRSRATSLHAQIEVDGLVGNGTKVSLWFPVERRS